MSPARTMSRGEPSIQFDLNREWMEASIMRWKAAEEYISYLDLELLPRDHVSREFINSDVPKVVREFTRLRPDLLV